MIPGTQPQPRGAAAREPAPIGALLRPVEYYLKGGRRNLLAVQEALRAVLPPELAGQVQAQRLRGGTLTLSVPDAAGKCLLEAVLRGGALDALRGTLPNLAVRNAAVVLA